MSGAKKLSPQDREELVAFLDQEVGGDAADRVSSRIANDSGARQEADALKQTWELLDFLPRPTISEDFSQRTSQLIRLRAKEAPLDSEPLTQQPGPLVHTEPGGWLMPVWLVGLSVCFLAGLYWGWNRPRSDDALLRDLPVLERYDDLRAVGDAEFLRSLRDSKIFEKRDEVQR